MDILKSVMFKTVIRSTPEDVFQYKTYSTCTQESAEHRIVTKNLNMIIGILGIS